MAGITLSPNEYVLAELREVQDNNSIIAKLFNVTLTNQRIIFCKIGAFGKEKFAFDKQISSVKVFNGEAQVKVTTVHGTQTKLDIYFDSDQLSFGINGAGNTEAIQFANALNKTVTNTDIDLYSLTGSETGFSAFKKAFWGINSIEAKKHHNQKVAMRCSGCGATFEGIKGKTSRCPYCGSVYNS